MSRRAIALFCLGLLAACGIARSNTPLARAEALRAAGKYREAIAEYETHKQNRIRQAAPGESPSPYFFSLLIGDLHLQLDEPEEAKAAYIEARDHDASHALVAHKIRYLGHWYEDHGKNDEAMQIYTEFHDLDPQLFEMDQDRLYKAMLATGAKAPTATPTPARSGREPLNDLRY